MEMSLTFPLLSLLTLSLHDAQIKSIMRARMLGARGRVVQKGIGESHVFLHTRALWAEPNG